MKKVCKILTGSYKVVKKKKPTEDKMNAQAGIKKVEKCILLPDKVSR